MSKPKFAWFKHFVSEDIAETQLLSDDATAVYHRLQMQYFYLGGVPAQRPGSNPDADVRRLARMSSKRNWQSIRNELIPGVFDADWNHHGWDKLLDEQGDLSTKRARAAGARYAKPDGPAPTGPVPEGPDDETIPF